MKAKIILTSAIAIMTAIPAMATSYSAGDSANCDNSVLNVYSGSASATAGFSAKSYTCSAGTYLPDGDTWSGLDDGCDTCPANSYCPGDTYTYSEASDQGATACSTVSNGAYPYSDSGKGTTADCYRNCASGDVANLKSGGTMTGRYYSDATNTCEPSDSNQCANGYHYTAGVNPTTISTTVGQGGASDYGCKSNSGIGNNRNGTNLENGEFYVDYGTGHGVIKGHARCSKTGVTTPWYDTQDYTFASDHFVNNLTDETGESGAQYCYCQLDSYKLDDGALQSLSAPWVFRAVAVADASCAAFCAGYCANYLQGGDARFLAFRAAALGAIQSSPAQCSANEITINWGGYGANNDQNETNTCTYNETLTAPSTAPTKRGHNFTGWTFDTPSQN